MILFIISLLVLVLLVGIAVDLGSWYLRASKMQRAADVAALAGASSLPNADEARDRAIDSFKRNGWVNNSRTSVDAQIIGGRVVTSARDREVPTYFLRPLFTSIDMTRKSNAVKSSAIPLGNPFNIFGYGSNTGTSSGIGISSAPQGFWASVNAYCTPKEDGDYFSSRFDANKGTTSHVCNDGTRNNTDYSPTGYNYIVDVPAAAGTVDLLIWDAQYNPNESGAGDVNAKLSGDSEAGMDTTYNLYNTQGTDRTDDDGAPIASPRFRDADPTAGVSGSGWAIWSRLATVGAGQYRINVTSQVPTRIGMTNPRSTGWNNFALMASRTSAPYQVCDSRTAAATCPRISGKGAVSVLANKSGGTADFYLAEINQGFIGTQLEAFLWDPGEGTERIELISPSGAVSTFSWSVTPATPTGATGTGTFLDVSGTGPQPKTGLRGDSKFNDRLVTLKFTPKSSDYSSGSNAWWKLRYKAGSGVVTDRTTWGVNVGNNTPVYLTNPN